jgi:exodeoxyribonuclease VII large subunit
LEETDFHIFSIEEITLFIKKKLTSDATLKDIWITGEISNFLRHSSGHLYFTLKDENSQLPCAMFRWANENLKFEPRDGMKVLAKGNIDVYAPQGRYNFVVSEIHPKGAGELYLKFMQLKEKLQKEGLFDIARKKPIPRFPNTIGVVTSPTGAALRDIVNVTKRRYPLANILVVPTQVQGDSAKYDIEASIELLNRYKKVDVMIVGRGGGSLEDLWPFNEEIVARAIFNSKIPVISAVGHETDFSIADFVADLRAPTPSAAAELVVPDMHEILKGIQGKYEALLLNIRGIVTINEKNLQTMKAALKPRLLMDRIITHHQTADSLSTKMSLNIRHQLTLFQGRFDVLAEMLDAVSPLSTLRRGYSITMKLPQKEVVDSVKKIKEKDQLRIIISDGELECNVDKIKRMERMEKQDN